MRRLPLIVATLLLVTLVISTIGCGGNGSSPEDTVKEFLKAFEAEDVDKAFSYWVQPERQEALGEAEELEEFFSRVSVEFSNIDTTLVSQTGDKATVEVSYDIEMKIGEESNKEYQQETAELVRVDGKWLIEDM